MNVSGPIDVARAGAPGTADGARPVSPPPLALLACSVARLVAVIAGR